MSNEEILKLAREAGLHIYPEYTTAFTSFANAVIKAHTEELIAGVGEPAVWFDTNTGAASFVKPLRPTYEPCYTATQVAAAVAKDRKSTEEAWSIYDQHIDCDAERIAELEAGNHDLRKWIDATGQGVLLQRLATLESTLLVALEALDELMEFQVKHMKVWNNPAYDIAHKVSKQIKEVLHG